MTLSEFESKISGTVSSNGEFENLAHAVVNRIESILTFCDDSKFITSILNNPRITCVIIQRKFLSNFKTSGLGIILSDDPRMDFFKIHNILRRKEKFSESEIGKGTIIKPNCFVSDKNVIIGNDCLIESNVIIHPNTIIGDNTIIRAGSIIGGNGFQFWKNSNEILTVEHFGKTRIGSNVEIKEFCSIHKAVFDWDSTVIKNNTKIDSHVHIGHGNKIGSNVYLCSHSNISGNSIIEDNCYIGPGVNIPNRILIGSNSKISVGATVTKNVVARSTVSGNFAILHEKYLEHIKRISS